jgi:hypothetical protein
MKGTVRVVIDLWIEVIMIHPCPLIPDERAGVVDYIRPVN